MKLGNAVINYFTFYPSLRVYQQKLGITIPGGYRTFSSIINLIGSTFYVRPHQQNFFLRFSAESGKNNKSISYRMLRTVEIMPQILPVVESECIKTESINRGSLRTKNRKEFWSTSPSSSELIFLT
jgi:hypothetical protein